MIVYLKEKHHMLLRKTEVLKTTVENHVSNLFPENIAFNIATFLEESTKENKSRE